MQGYSKTSPYYTTDAFGAVLDVANIRELPKEASDKIFVITDVYRHRPDLLAHDLYGDVSLWWVFSIRNPNTLEDPVFDFIPGLTIFLPKKQTIQNALGI